MSTPTAREWALGLHIAWHPTPYQNCDYCNAIERAILDAEARGKADGVRLALRAILQVKGEQAAFAVVSELGPAIKAAAKAAGIEIGDET